MQFSFVFVVFDVYIHVRIIHHHLLCIDSMAPEIIPPITNVATYTRSTKPAKARSNSSTAVLVSESGTTASSRGWTGGEFVPAASRSYVLQQQQPVSLQSSAGSRSKRYSSQRQRNPGEGGIHDGGNQEPRLLPAAPVSASHSSHLVTVAPVLPLQARPLTPAFFGMFAMLLQYI